MRSVVVVLALASLPLPARADEKESRPVPPAEAAKLVNKKCTVEMEVKSTGRSQRGGLIFLNSEANYRDGKNFTLLIDRKAADKLKKAGIADPAAHFKGKTVYVSGTVTLYQNRPQIQVEEPGQIKVVEKKKDEAPKKDK
jgi:DNA/RNA endonuclease YhcR with UshA esterase domain